MEHLVFDTSGRRGNPGLFDLIPKFLPPCRIVFMQPVNQHRHQIDKRLYITIKIARYHTLPEL